MKNRTNVRHSISAKASGKTVSLFLYGEVDRWEVSARGVVAALADHADATAIEVNINSPGGSIFEGLAIYNTLHRHAAKKIVTVDGMAMSIASLIAMVGDEIRMGAGTQMMVHEPHMRASGTAADFLAAIERLEAAKAQMIAIYSARTGLDAEALAELLADETYMDADEAVAQGFAGEVVAAKAVAARFDLVKFGYQGVPDAVRQLAMGPAAPSPPADSDTTSGAQSAPAPTPMSVWAR